MSITFSCGHCGKSLTTSEDKAGRQAKCPGCGEVVTVPVPETGQDDELPDREDTSEDDLPAPPPLKQRKPRPDRTCAMCGAVNTPEAEACQSCGEPLAESVQRGLRTDVEVGEVMSDAWETFKEKFGVCVGAHIITIIVIGMSAIPLIALGIVIAIMMDHQGNGPPKDPPIGPLLGLIPAVLIVAAVACFMSPGLMRFYISAARNDDDLELTSIFKGGSLFLPFLGYGLLFGLCASVGLLACGVGYLVVMVLGWPLLYLVCDSRNPGRENIVSRTLEMTKPNWVTSLLLFFVIMGMQLGLNLVGIIPCVGPIVSMASILIQPYFQLLWATAYVKMSDQEA